MTDLIYDSISQGVDLILTAIMLSGIITLLYTSTYLNNLITVQQERLDKIQVSKSLNQYDNATGLTKADVVSCIIAKGDDYTIFVGWNGNSGITQSLAKSTYQVSGIRVQNTVRDLHEKPATEISTAIQSVSTSNCKLGYVIEKNSSLYFYPTNDYEAVTAILFY